MLETQFLGIPFLEWIGYAASVLVLLSLSMSSIIKLRWFNLAGAILFSTYGFLIGSLPVGIMNFLIVLANIYNLRKMYYQKEDFHIVKLNAKDPLLEQFLKHYQKDIHNFYPEFVQIQNPDILNFFVLRNMSVAGIFIAAPKNTQGVSVELDYALPQYRDFKVGSFLYNELDKILAEAGFEKIYCEPERNKGYLKRMGFTPGEIEGKKVLERNISK
ncbi:MAG: hypothetical protein ACEPOZ_03050 [Marinifilaceae bacterium]